MKLSNFDTFLVATSVSDGTEKFHPGLRHGHHVFYWENRKMLNEDDAVALAQVAINDALAAANSVIEAWNLTSLT